MIDTIGANQLISTQSKFVDIYSAEEIERVDDRIEEWIIYTDQYLLNLFDQALEELERVAKSYDKKLYR